MKQLLPYEEIIAKKMETLPVPDMQDAIWSSIQANLNSTLTDTPNDSTSISQGVTVSTGKIVTGFIISVIIIAVTVMVASRKKKGSQQIKQLPEITQPQVPVIDSPSQEGQNKKSTAPYKTDTGTAVPSPTNTDTFQKISPVFPLLIKPDSSRIIVPLNPGKDIITKLPTDQPKKKTIGVTEISDSSYRISGKKDNM
jgi:hypothetical protein